MSKILTLGLIVKDKKILLGMKKRGFGAGKWNGFGGKVEPGESVEDALEREVREETGLNVLQYSKKALLNFNIDTEPEQLEGHIFLINEFEGEPIETDEMKPQWFSLNDLPYDLMWAGDIHWLPLVLGGKTIKATFNFLDESTLVSHDITEVNSLS